MPSVAPGMPEARGEETGKEKRLYAKERKEKTLRVGREEGESQGCAGEVFQGCITHT